MSENGNGSQVETAVDEREELAENTATDESDSEDEGDQSDGALGNFVKKCEI
jgi:hypothetical protein